MQTPAPTHLTVTETPWDQAADCILNCNISKCQGFFKSLRNMYTNNSKACLFHYPTGSVTVGNSEKGLRDKTPGFVLKAEVIWPHAATLPLILIADISNRSQSSLGVTKTNVAPCRHGMGKAVPRLGNELREETVVKSHMFQEIHLLARESHLHFLVLGQNDFPHLDESLGWKLGSPRVHLWKSFLDQGPTAIIQPVSWQEIYSNTGRGLQVMPSPSLLTRATTSIALIIYCCVTNHPQIL